MFPVYTDWISLFFSYPLFVLTSSGRIKSSVLRSKNKIVAQQFGVFRFMLWNFNEFYLHIGISKTKLGYLGNAATWFHHLYLFCFPLRRQQILNDFWSVKPNNFSEISLSRVLIVTNLNKLWFHYYSSHWKCIPLIIK